jgi:hypothetical protein
LATAKEIRDDKGDGSAAFATARLKAIATIEGREGSASVNVQVNQFNGGAGNVSPGYVIRLKPQTEAPQPRPVAPVTIEGEVLPND